ncbi:MAG: ferrous iron transport protein B [Planctomycetes bacterium]|nr:ferrous iron transport protein B [Planctomycetota bacterium]
MGNTATTAVVALVGNPNCGKTTLFNALTGFKRIAANYPGVTVDIGRGPIRGMSRPAEALDLPGTYSLAATSPDELIVADTLWGRLAGAKRPDLILAIADASNISRNFYLVSQLLELGLPVVIALNMIDVARSRGLEVDVAQLSERLGVPVVPVVATRADTIPPLTAALSSALDCSAPPVQTDLPADLRREAHALAERSQGRIQPAEAVRVLLDCAGDECCAERRYLAAGGQRAPLRQARERLRAAGIDGPAAEVRARYAWINRLLEPVVRRPDKPVTTWSDRLDRVLTHWLWGGLILLGVLALAFQAIFAGAGPLMHAIDGLFAWLGQAIGGLLPTGVARSLLSDGIIAGIGGVLVFLPQILILFLCVAVLEDCGYMSRAAYMIDRPMRALGLSGRAFIPLLSSFACAVPAIMGTRVIADRRERFVTIMIAPFMSCSARLPVYVLMIGAFVPRETYLGGWAGLQGLVMLAMYLVGVVVAIPVAWLLRKTAFAGPPTGFMLELPTYKLPGGRVVLQRVYLGGRSFIVRAGTIILLVNLVVWALAYFPHSAATEAAIEQRARAAGWDERTAAARLAAAHLRESYLGRMGRAIEPAIRPLGWDWRIGVGVIASFPAREVIVATLGTIYGLGGDQAEDSGSLLDALKSATWPETDEPVFNLPVALSIMVFFALCAQCSGTLVVMGREMGSWVWPVVSFLSMTTLAYGAALVVALVTRAVGL